MHNLKRVWTYLVIVAVAMLAALNYELFVFSKFLRPLGAQRYLHHHPVCQRHQRRLYEPAVNIPLALLVFFKVSKPVAVRSMVYVVVFSVGLLILDKVDLSRPLPIPPKTEPAAFWDP